MILVTGGTGLIGSHLLFKLASGNKNIIAVTREKSSVRQVEEIFKIYHQDTEFLMNRIRWYEGDLTDRFFVNGIIKDVQHVYHCAAIVSLNSKLSKDRVNANVSMTANLVDECLEDKIHKLCHVSSIATLPPSVNGIAVNEKDGWQKETGSIYAEGKIKSEFEIWRGIQEGLNAVIVNPSVVIGPGRFDRGSGNIFDAVYKKLRYYTSGSAGFVDVMDVVEIMIKLMESDVNSERFVLSSENLAFYDLLGTISKYLGVKAPGKCISQRNLERIARLEKIRSFMTGKDPKISKDSIPAMTHKNSYDASKICEVLDYTFSPVEGAVERTAKYYLDKIHRLT
jgi:dihydroflavonol-4-reductase